MSSAATIDPADPVAAKKSELGGVRRVAKLHTSDASRGHFKSAKLVGPDGETVVLPETLFALLKRIASVLADDDAVVILPVRKQLTTQQAANILNVSRQYLVDELLTETDEKGRLPFKKTAGGHRRIALKTLLGFKRTWDKRQEDSLRDLIRLSEEADGYPELR